MTAAEVGPGPGGSSADASRSLAPPIRVVWRVRSALAGLLAAGATLAIELLVDRSDAGLPWPAGTATAVVVAVAGLATAWYPIAAYRHWSFRLGANTLDLRRGVLWRAESATPYHRVQHVDISHGPLDRWLGLARLVVHTASATTDATIPGVASGEAEELRARILARAGVGDAV